MSIRLCALLLPVALVAAGTAPGAAPQTTRNAGFQAAQAVAFARASTAESGAAALPEQTATVRPAPAKPVTTQTKPAAAQSSAQEKLPPLSYVCIMPGDEAVLEDKPGKCPNPKCGMELVPVRLTSAWSSVTHPTIIQDQPGKDPLDKRDLVQITASMFWVCPGSDDHLLEPGTCADGHARQIKYERRPHGDHNPRHGGSFFMADDSWHHLEGTYPHGGPFRVFFYDDYTRPMPVKGFSGTVVLLDPNEKELDSFPLKPGRISNALEAPIKGEPLPLKVKLKVRFDPEGKERSFDFTFAENTKEPSSLAPSPVVSTASATAARPPAPRSTAPASGASKSPAATALPAPAPNSPASAATPPPVLGAAPDVAASSLSMSRSEAAGLAQDLPNNPAELLKLMELRRGEVETLIHDGSFGMVYVPTMMAKDVALALGDHAGELTDRQRVSLTSAVRKLVVAAWRLDQYGDLGDRDKITQAYSLFAAAAAEIKDAYAERR
jgi:hypothetical protein